MNSKQFTFGEGIEFVLKQISISPEDRLTFQEDAQQIENEFVQAISRRDPFFARAFRGLSLTGSNLNKVKINLPDEFDMLTKVALPCGMKPVPVAGNPGYVHLRVDGDNVPLHLTDRLGDFYYINRRKVQSWFRENINAVIPQLNHIRCGGGRSYELSNRSGGHVAHTIKARCLSDPGRKISFDFVPAFEFMASEWPRAFPKYPHKDHSWYAVPRKIRSPIGEDPLSFIVCAPHWERMRLEKKQNLKDALRLMKALREGNNMHLLFSYAIKSVFLNATSQKRINWNQSPGRILIRAVDYMAMFLRKRFLPFYLVPEANLFEDLPEDQAQGYIRILRRIFRRLIKCRDRNCMTTEDIQIIFGNGVLMSPSKFRFKLKVKVSVI